jgi:hypothetical protein
VANLVYKRVSTDQRPTAPQNLVLAEVGITAVPAVHCGLLARCQPLDGGQGIQAAPAQRKARREYESRVSTLAPTGPWPRSAATANFRSDIPEGRSDQESRGPLLWVTGSLRSVT